MLYKVLLKILVVVSLLFVYSCDARKSNINKKISTLQNTQNEIKANIAINQKTQLQLLKKINSLSEFSEKSSNIFANYFFSPYISQYKDLIFNNNEKQSHLSNKSVSNIIFHLSNLYDGNEPQNYAFITLYDSIDWDIKIFKVFKGGSLVSLVEKCSKPECNTYYIYIEGLQGVDRQILKKEFLLEYKGSFTHNILLLDVETVPHFKIIKRISYSNSLVINKWLDLQEKNKLLDSEVQYSKISNKSKKYTLKYLDSESMNISIADYDYEFANSYLATYNDSVESLLNYNKLRMEFFKSNNVSLYNSLMKEKDYYNYMKTFKDNKVVIYKLQKEYAILVKNLESVSSDIEKLKKSL